MSPWGVETWTANDWLHSCLGITSACRTAGCDPLRSGWVGATVETAGAEHLLPVTAALSGWGTWRYLMGEEARVHLQPCLQEGIECWQQLAHLQLSPYQHPPFWKYLHGCIEMGRSCRYLHLDPNLQPPFMKYLQFESLKLFSMCTDLTTIIESSWNYSKRER